MGSRSGHHAQIYSYCRRDGGVMNGPTLTQRFPNAQALPESHYWQADADDLCGLIPCSCSSPQPRAILTIYAVHTIRAVPQSIRINTSSAV